MLRDVEDRRAKASAPKPPAPKPAKLKQQGPKVVRPRRKTVAADEPDRIPAPRKSTPAPRRKPAAKKPAATRRGGGGRGGGNRGGGGGGFRPGDLIPRGLPWRRMGYWAAVAMLWAGVGLGTLAFFWAMELPDTADLAVPGREPTVTILANDGTVLARRGSGFARAVEIDELPPYLPQAFIAIEDRRFYDHAGVDPKGIARAMLANIAAMDVVQGGSTITQQLAKNLFLKPERTLKRKVQETMLALWLESEYDKDEILTLYLNRVYFGAGAYGIEAAAQRYFDKDAAELTVPEAAMMAGLVKAPSRLAPTNNPDGAKARAAIVIAAMKRDGYLPDVEADAAEAFPAEVAARAETDTGYAVDWVEEQLSAYVARPDRDITVETTLDPKLQIAAVGAVRSAIAAAAGQDNVEQGALVAMSPDGAVRALVGGRNYQESQYNRATTAKRQPGSAFKTFVYLTAMERGLTPVTTRLDAPVQVANYAPENYAGSYEGNVTLMHALSKSINSVAVRLAHEVGAPSVARTARRMGIQSDLRTDLSLALGSSEVTLAELTGAYAPFANGGYGVFPHVITRVTMDTGDGGTEELYRREGDGPGRVVSRANVGRMNAMLAETIASGTGRRAQIGRPAAGKTGTSQDNRDAWFVGYTADMVAGVWVGNDDARPMASVTGGKLPAEIWANFMTAAHAGIPAHALPGNWEPPVAVAAVPQYGAQPGGNPNGGAVPAYNPEFGPPGYRPGDPPPPPPRDEEPGFFARLFGAD